MELSDKSIVKNLSISGIIFTLVIFLWPVFMAVSSLNGSIEMQLEQIRNNPVPFRLNFVLASLIGPSLSYLMITVGLFLNSRKKTPVLNSTGIFFLLPYVVFVSIAYTSQFTLVTNSLFSEKPADAIRWYFGNFHSIAYFFNQLGYTFFAISGFCIGYRFLFDKGPMKIFGWLLYVSSFLSITAFIGLVLNSKELNSLTVLSGMCILPLGIIAIIVSRRLKNLNKRKQNGRKEYAL